MDDLRLGYANQGRSSAPVFPYHQPVGITGMERGGGGGVGEVEITGQPNQVIKQPLKRNAACLSCRKRKLKCDALKPHCSTCQKSHAHAIRTNSIINAVLLCEYDDETNANEENIGGSTRKKGSTNATGKKRANDSQRSESRDKSISDAEEGGEDESEDSRSTGRNGSNRGGGNKNNNKKRKRDNNGGSRKPGDDGSVREEISELKKIIQDLQMKMSSSGNGGGGGGGGAQQGVMSGEGGGGGNRRPGQFNNHSKDSAGWPGIESYPPTGPAALSQQQQQQQRHHHHQQQQNPGDQVNFLDMLSSAAVESDKSRGSTSGSGSMSRSSISTLAQGDQARIQDGFMSVTSQNQFINTPSDQTFHKQGSYSSLSNSNSSANEASPPDQTAFIAESPGAFIRSAFPNLSRMTSGNSSLPSSPLFASANIGLSPLGKEPPLVANWSPSNMGMGNDVNYQTVGKDGLNSQGGMDANGNFVLDEEQRIFETVEEGGDLTGIITDQVLMDILWPGWPKTLPEPGLMNHLVDILFEQVPLMGRIFDQDTFRSRMALPPTHHNFPHQAILHSICASTARYSARVYTVPPESEPWKRSNEYVENPAAEPDFGMRHALYAERLVRDCIDRASDLYEATQATVLLAHHYHTYSKWLHAWVTTGFLNRLLVPLGLCDGNRRVVSMLSKPSLLGDWKDDIEREERRNLLWIAISYDVTSSAVGGWAGTIMLDEVTTLIPSQIIPTDAGNVFIEADQSIQSPDLFRRHPIRTGWNMYIKAIILVSRINRFTRTWRTRHSSLSPEEGRKTKEFIDLDAMIGTFVLTFPPELRDPLTPDNSEGRSRPINLELFMAQIFLHQGTICLHEMFADVTNPADVSTQRLLASARGILRMVYLLNATSLDVSTVMPAGFGFYTAARTLLLFLDHALESGSNTGGGSEVLRSEIEVFRMVFEAYGKRFPIGVRHASILVAMLQACDAKYGGGQYRPPQGTTDPAHKINTPPGQWPPPMPDDKAATTSPFSFALNQNKPVPLTEFLDQRRGYSNVSTSAVLSKEECRIHRGVACSCPQQSSASVSQDGNQQLLDTCGNRVNRSPAHDTNVKDHVDRLMNRSTGRNSN